MAFRVGYVDRIVGYQGNSAILRLLGSSLQWITSLLAPSTGVDRTVNSLDLDLVDSNCASVLNGATLTVTGLTTSNVATNSGTATPTVSADTITFTAGTVYELKIDGELVYPVAGGVGLTANSIIPLTWPDATFSAATWTTQSVYHYNTLQGHSKVLKFNGTSAFCPIEFYPDANTDFVCATKFDLVGQGTLYGANDGADHRCYFGVLDDASGGYGYQVGYGTGFAVSTAKDDGEWHDFHYSKGKLYVDDVLVADASAQTFSGTSTTRFCIGAVLSGVSTPSFTRSEVSYFKSIVIDNGSTCLSQNAYSDGTNIILPDSNDPSGSSNATGTNVAEKYIPALADGTDDTEGLGLTNPATGFGNNSEATKLDKATSTALLDTPYLSDNGTTFDKKSFGDAITHVNFVDNVIHKASSLSSIQERIVFPIDKEWTPSEYELIISYLGDSVTESLTPLTDVDEEYILDENGKLIFPSGE